MKSEAEAGDGIDSGKTYQYQGTRDVNSPENFPPSFRRVGYGQGARKIMEAHQDAEVCGEGYHLKGQTRKQNIDSNVRRWAYPALGASQ